MNKIELIKLRQDNCGYNPEKAEDVGEVDQVDNFTLYITDLESNHTNVFYKDESIKTEIDFIKEYPRTYGVIYNGEYYFIDN